MAATVETIEIHRRPDDVFAYATDRAQFPHWQGEVVSARSFHTTPLQTGSKAAVIRKVGPRKLDTIEQITSSSKHS